MRIAVCIICLSICTFSAWSDKTSNSAMPKALPTKVKKHLTVKESFAPFLTEIAAAQRMAQTELIPDNEMADAARDMIVLNVVLNDLLTGDRRTMIYLRTNDKSGQEELDFSSSPSKYPVTVNQLLSDSLSSTPDAESWENLSKKQIRAAIEGMGSLANRCKANTEFGSLTEQNSKVRMRKEDEANHQEVAFHLVTAHRPGYSKNKDTAVINVTYYWSMHHANALYVLEKKNDQWSIIFCQHIYFV